MPGQATSRSGGAIQPAARSLNADAVLWRELAKHLEEVRRSVLAEIRSYPSPIAGCDQQFNHLLEQRARIARGLSRLASIRQGDPATGADIEALGDLIEGSDGIAGERKGHLVERLRQARWPSPGG